MDYKLTKLSNGLRIITIPMPALESATVTVWVGTGSRYETAQISGISHFLEHMVFKGGKKYSTAKDIAEAVDNIGGEFNAGTSKEWTNFYIRSRAAKLETAMDVLSDMVLNPVLDEKEIEKEKGVIVEEIAMYEDTPMQNIGNIYEQLLFKGNQLGLDIAGTPKTVRSIQKSDFVRYRKLHYFAENIVLTVSGGIDEKEILKLAENYFGGLESKPGKKEEFEKYVDAQQAPQVFLKTKDNSEQAHILLGFRGFKRGEENRFAELILASILGGGMSSRLFIEVREKRGLAYAVTADGDHYIDTGSFGAYAGVVLSKVDEAIKVILDEFYGLKDKKMPISKEELSKAKEYIRGHIALGLENTKAVNSFFGEKQLLLNKIETPEEIFEKISKVTLEDVYTVAEKLFNPKKVNLALIGPFQDQERFARLLK